MTLTPLGDQAVLATLTDEAAALRLAAAIRKANPAWLQDVVPAYATVGVFFDADRAELSAVVSWMQSLQKGGFAATIAIAKSLVIPVCYEIGRAHV